MGLNSSNSINQESTNNVGARLKYEREKRGISVAEIANQLHLPERTIQALEDDRNDELPAEVYVRGYIRSYCQLLNISRSDLLVETAAPSEQPTTDILTFTTSERTQQLIRVWGSFLIVSIILILVGLWWTTNYEPETTMEKHLPANTEYQEPMDQSDTVMEKQLLVLPPATEAATPAGTILDSAHSETTPSHSEKIDEEVNAIVSEQQDNLIELVIYAGENCWVRIEDSRGKILIHREVAPNEYNTVSGYSPFDVRIGKVSVIKLWVDGHIYDLNQHHISSLDTTFFQLVVSPE